MHWHTGGHALGLNFLWTKPKAVKLSQPIESAGNNFKAILSQRDTALACLTQTTYYCCGNGHSPDI